MDFGEQPSPVLIVTFTAQQIIYVSDASGKVVEGEKVFNFECKVIEIYFINNLIFVVKKG